MKRLYIYGGGSISIETIRLVNKINLKKKIWDIQGIITNSNLSKKSIEGIKLFNEKKIEIKVNSYAICAIGDPTIKANLKIGNNFTILPNSTIGGYVYIGNNVMIGSGANILPKVKIGNNSRVGIGSTIIKNIKSNTTVLVDQKKIILPRKSI